MELILATVDYALLIRRRAARRRAAAEEAGRRGLVRVLLADGDDDA